MINDFIQAAWGESRRNALNSDEKQNRPDFRYEKRTFRKEKQRNPVNWVQLENYI